MLYRPPSRKPFAAFDQLVFPVNHVAFHPSEPAVSIATGTYDGGWVFEGELVLWNWERGLHSTEIGPIPDVVHSRFCDDGTCIIAHVRPWNEDMPEVYGDPFDSFFEVRAAYSADLFEGIFNKDSIPQQLSGQTPKSIHDLEFDLTFPVDTAAVETALGRAFGLAALTSRSAIWDSAWIGKGDIAIVHNDCQLEVLGSDGDLRDKFVGTGHGAQIFKRPKPIVHVVLQNDAWGSWQNSYRAKLLRYDGFGLDEFAEFDGRYAFSVSQDGWCIGRRDRSFDRDRREMDIIGNLNTGAWSEHNLGHYDVFNHFLRVDDCPHLFFVQGTPATSHERKYLCRVSTHGSVERLWALLRNSGSHASHAMECAFGYVADSAGEGLIVSGKHYHPDPGRPYSGFVYRKRLSDGQEAWRHETKANATAIKSIPDLDLVVVAFLNGDVAAIQSQTGTILHWTEFRPEGISGVIYAFDISADGIVVGTLDGRVGIVGLDEFLDSGIN